MSRELFQRSLEEKRVSWLENRDVGGRRWKTRSLLALKVMLGLGLAAGTAWIVPRFGGNVRGLIYRQDLPITTLDYFWQNIQAALSASRFGYVLEAGRITLEGEAAALRETSHIKQAYLGL